MISVHLLSAPTLLIGWLLEVLAGLSDLRRLRNRCLSVAVAEGRDKGRRTFAFEKTRPLLA